MGYGNLKKAILCKIGESYFNVKDYKAQNIKPDINRNRALLQFENLKNTLAKAGVSVIKIPELKEHPNSVFVRDTAAIAKDSFIKLRMGLKSRRGEEEWMADFLKSSIGLKEIGSIKPPGTAEGGDVIIGEKVAFVGISNRTNENGAIQVSEILKDIGYETRIAKFKGPFLHIGGGMSLIGKNTILHCKNAFPEGFFEGFKEILVDCNDFIGGNVIAISEKEVVASKTNRNTIKILKAEGITVHELDLSEFVKGNGGPSCMILPLASPDTKSSL